MKMSFSIDRFDEVSEYSSRSNCKFHYRIIIL